MTEDDWNDDTAYDDAVRRARRATRMGWTAITGTVATLGCVAVVIAGACLVAVFVCAYLVVSVNR